MKWEVQEEAGNEAGMGLFCWGCSQRGHQEKLSPLFPGDVGGLALVSSNHGRVSETA